MKYKKYFTVGLLLLVLLVSIGIAAAAENATAESSDADDTAVGASASDASPASDEDSAKEDVKTSKLSLSVDDNALKAKPKTASKAKISCRSYWATTKDSVLMKAVVKDKNGKAANGNVVFRVNKKSYIAKAKNGIATKIVKIKKAGHYTYAARFAEKGYSSLAPAKAKLHVYSITKKARTFSLKGYKTTISEDRFKKLVKAKNTNSMASFEVGTNKYVKQKYRHYIGNSLKYVYKTVNARVMMVIAYGGADGTQTAPQNMYSLYLFTRYQIPDSFARPHVSGTVTAKDISKLN